MKRLIFTLMIFAQALAACAPAATPAPMPTLVPTVILTEAPTAIPTPPGLFDYDASLPFAEKIISETEQDGVVVIDLTYAAHDADFASTLGGRTSAYLVKPKGASTGADAGVLFMHWLGASNGGKKEFLDEAIILAQHGVVSLLIQGQVPWMTQYRFDERDVSGVQKQVAEMRRALDFLVSQSEVDKERLAVVGHDYGGMYAGILAGIDNRPKTFVIVAAAPSFGDWAGAYGKKTADVAKLMESVEPVNFIGQAQNASFLFQFGEQDGFVPAETAQKFFEAAAGEKEIRFYPTGHAMSIEQVVQERADWLAEKLGLMVASN